MSCSRGKDARLVAKFRRLFSHMKKGDLGMVLVIGTEDGASKGCLIADRPGDTPKLAGTMRLYEYPYRNLHLYRCGMGR